MEGDKIKIVCADDNIAVRRVFREIINEESDMELVGEAVNGLDLLSVIKDKKPKVVILDIIMPKLDGIEVIKKVKADDNIKQKPIFIVVSAIGNDRITKEAFEAGVEYYILKPVDKDILVERIHWALAQDKERKKVEELKRINTYTDMEIKIMDILLKLGMPVHIVGQRFMREALIMTMKDRECVSSITKLLYPDIARKNKTTPARVERSMRHAIEVVWTKGDCDWLEEIFGRPAGNISTRPTNSEFIARMAEYISIKLSIAEKNGIKVDSLEQLRHIP